uniref:Dicer-like nuclease 1 n=1 Tax=Chlamydomonas reinhardtii TaxID=3055 RepID=B3GN09_CHLRE|nr:dicer-like nuclease 1 [Chlamydomonas reinhardtii]
MGTALPPLREYQAELLRMARRHASTVIYAETGTGKTRIAVERILEAHGELVAAGRLAAFLAPTVPLVRQQAEVLVAAGLRVVVYTGEDNRDARNRAGWQRLHQEADVLCATPDALNRLIAHAFITIPQLGMIVFDECHHTNANHPYAVLLRVFVRHLTPPDQRPVLLGLTASPHKADELMRLLGAQMVAASNTAQLQTFMAKPRVEVHRQEVEQPATVAPPQRRLASGTFSAAASILPPECAAAVASGDAADMRKAGEALHAGGGSCIAAQPMAALDGAIELVSAAVEYSRCRDQTFRRCCALGEPLPEMRAPRYTSPLLRGIETPQRWWEQDPQCGTKHLEHLRSQLAGVKDALSSMGLWPAVAVAAADLFGPTAAPPQPATLLRLLDSEEGSAWPHLQQRKRLRRGRDNEQRPVPPAAEDVDSSDSDCEDEGDNLPAEHSSSAAGEGEDEGDEADEATLWGYQIGELLEEGGLGDGSEASSIADHRDRAALLVSGLAVMLPPALREAVLATASPTEQQQQQQQQAEAGVGGGGWTIEARAVQLAMLAAAVVLTELVWRKREPGSAAGSGSGQGDLAGAALLQGFAAVFCPGQSTATPGPLHPQLHPLAARDRGDAQPWAELLLRAVPLNKLQQQVLGQDLPSRPAAAATAAVPLAAVVGVPLVTPAVQWVVRSLLALSTQRHPADSGGDGVSVSSGWSAMVFCQRKVACVALHRLLTELPAARGGAIRPAVFMGNTGAGHSASSLAMDGRKQERVRRAFSSGALNVLISTSVGAEGLDFRTCNAVIMVDPPDHVTPFVQCAGRARAPGSCYLLFARDDRQQQAIAKRSREEADMVAKALKLSTAAAREAQQRQQTDPPVNPFFSQDVDVVTEELQQNLFRVPHTGAVMCGPLAQNLLESYCRTLPGNSGDVLLQPYYSYQEYESPLTRRKAFVATVHMPANSPLGVVEGPMQSNKGDARQHACMATVRRLYELGALDEHLLPRFTRRGRMREAQQQDLLEHKALPRVALSHRLPAALQPAALLPAALLPAALLPAAPHAAPAADAAGPAGGPPASSHVRGELVGLLHLYAFSCTTPFASTGGGGAATAAAATGRTRHRFGVVLHRRLPCDLPPFTAYLPPEDDSEAADGPQGQQPAPVAVRLEYLGPLRLSAAQLAALETAGGVMESLLITRGAQPVATSSSATADKPVAAPGPASAGPVPGSPALAAWSERLGPGLAALRRALAAAGIKTSAAYVHEAVNNVPDRMNSTAGEPATAAQLPASGHWWWLVAPLSEQTQAASSQTAGTEAAAAGAVDWGFLARLAAGPVPLQALCPQLPALRPLAQQPAQGHQQQRQQLLPAAATGADVGSVGLHGHRQAAAPGGQHVELLTAAVREALRGSGGLLITQTGATLHALRGLTAVAEHDEAGTGSRKAAQDAARLVERWGVDPSCLLPDQPQVLVDAGTATRTASNVLLAPPQPEHHPHSHHGAEDGSREAAAVISMLPQALAVAPLSVRCWRALHRTVSLVHRLEGLLVAAEAEEELLRPAGFLRPAATAAASGNPVLAIPVPTTAPSTSTATTAAATPQQAAVLLALTALTARAAADPAFDCERLETLGDAVLKYLATLYVYGTERDVPVSHEGVMSYKRDQLVANEALYGRALEAGLQHHMRALPYDMERVLRGRHWNTGEEAARAQEVRGKRLADCVEALVGCHLAPGVPTAGSSSNSNDAQATSPGSASAPVLVPVSATNPVPGAPCQDGSALAALVAALRQTCAPASGHTGVTDPSSNSGDVHARLDAALRFCCGLGVLPGAAPAVLQRLHAEGQGGAGEGAVQGVPDVGGEAGRAAVGALAAATGYQFHDPALALCALTHVSWPVPPVSSSGKGLDAGAGSGGGSGGHYQLLEFLGDAVVGLLASLWAYSLGGSPRDMSMTREMLVRNDTLAACCLGSRLSTALRVRHRQLQLAIEEYGVALLMSYDTTSGRADAAATGGGGPLIRAEMWKEAMAARDLRVATLLQSAWLEVEGGGTGEGEWQYTPWSRTGRGSSSGGGDGSHKGMASSGSSSSSIDGTDSGSSSSSSSSSSAVAAPRAPKVLADVVEAALGAIWLDSGGDLAVCEQAFRRLLMQHPGAASTEAGVHMDSAVATVTTAARRWQVMARAVPSKQARAALPLVGPASVWGGPAAAPPQLWRHGSIPHHTAQLSHVARHVRPGSCMLAAGGSGHGGNGAAVRGSWLRVRSANVPVARVARVLA